MASQNTPSDVAPTQFTIPTEAVGQEEETWVEVRGHPIFTRHFKPAQLPPRATLVLVHGFGEHCSRYLHVCRAFAAHGIEVLTYDQRGFGRTGRKTGPLGHTYGIKELHRDVAHFSRQVYQPGVPHFLFGHSMGGLVVLSYLVQYYPKHLPVASTNTTDPSTPAPKAQPAEEPSVPLAGVIGSGPCLQLAPESRQNFLMENLAIMLGKVFKSVAIKTALSLDDLCRDKSVIDAIHDDYYYFGIGSMQCIGDMFSVGPAMIKAGLGHVTTPVLLTHGEIDRTTNAKTTKEFHDQLPASLDKEYKGYPDCLHELHNEPNKEEVIEHWVGWILKRSQAPAPTPAA